jgi:hypothetical protein
VGQLLEAEFQSHGLYQPPLGKQSARLLHSLLVKPALRRTPKDRMELPL